MKRSYLYNCLDFNQVLNNVSSFAHTSIGKDFILNMTPSSDVNSVTKLLNITDEAIRVINYIDSFVFSGKINIYEYLKHVEVDGYLQSEQFLDILNHIELSKKLINYASDLDIKNIEYFNGLIAKLSVFDEIENEITRCINNSGEIRDSASFEIRKYRKSISSKEVEVRNKLQSLLVSKKSMLVDQIITIRNNKQVVAVKQEFKNVFGGIIHDESISGQTVYIEPSVCIDINNSIVELKIKLGHEYEKILQYLSSFIKVASNDIRTNLYVFETVDVMFAKARYANSVNGVRANISDGINLYSARHPLLNVSDVVANDIVFDDKKLLVITGANTGGKTITLKTVGLFVLMNQCGLHILSAVNSSMPIFDNVFTQMGDNQSVENNLSTFSAHILDLKYILDHCSAKSLILLDEVGNGTNPKEGAALAIAILEQLYQMGCVVIATTHYDELKEYATKNDYVVSASVKFDTNSLTPTYKLLLNTTGLSYALVIAKRLGISQGIISNAQNILHNSIDSNVLLLNKLSEEKLVIEESKKELEDLVLKNNQLSIDLEARQLEIDVTSELIINRAKNEANAIVEAAILKSDEVIKKLGNVVKHHELVDLKKELKDTKHDTKSNVVNIQTVIEIGDEVLVLPFETKAIVTNIDGDNYEVSMGNMKSVVNRSNLIFNYKNPKKSSSVSVSKNISMNIKRTLDLRGMRIDEVSIELEKYLDSIKLTNVSSVVIIHGYGTGAVRKYVIDYLTNNKYNYRVGTQSEGGSGVTVVLFEN